MLVFDPRGALRQKGRWFGGQGASEANQFRPLVTVREYGTSFIDQIFDEVAYENLRPQAAPCFWLMDVPIVEKRR